MSYAINNYRSKKFGNKYFITTDHGSYCVLDEDEFKKLKENNIKDPLLYTKLEECEIILNPSNINEAIRLTENRYWFLYQGTSLHIVIPTLRCNMNCIYCHASAKPANQKNQTQNYDMDQETAKKVVDFIFQSLSPCITIEFQGGEPLLNWDIVKFITEYAYEKNKEAKKDLQVTIVTNLSEMTDGKMNYIIDNNISICTSFDGPKEVHDYNRRFFQGSNYKDVVYWIKRFNEEYKKRNINSHKVNALITITRKSLKYPKEIIDEYVKLGINDLHIRFLNELGVARTALKDIGYSAEEFYNFWEKCANYIEKLKSEGINIRERMVELMLNKIISEHDPNYLDLRSPCGAAIGQLTYNYNGNIYTCDEARMLNDDLFMLGNVHKDNYKDIVTCDKACAVTSASINDQYICDNCVYKPYCGVCPVCNYAEQGTVIAKISETNRCKIYMKQFDWVVKQKIINTK